jgi:hypothetical protein
MYLMLGLGAIPLAALLGSTSLLFPAIVERSGNRFQLSPLRSLFVGLLVGGGGAALSLTLLSGEGNPLFLGLGGLLLILLVVMIIFGCSGVSLHIAMRLVDPSPAFVPTFLVGLSLIAIALIPVVGWYLFAPLVLAISSGAGFLGVFSRKRSLEESMPGDEKKGSWLGVRRPAWVLLILSPVVGELLSGSAPPVEFFNPISFLVLVALYGGGAVIIRELAFRWGKGWRSILLLGAAYGIIEEGLMVKSFFDPNWMDLGALGTYGRSLGVNWIWSLELTAYHMVISIAIPILLVNLLYPKETGRSWVNSRALWVFGGLFTLDVLVGFFLLTPYRPPVVPYLGSLGMVILLYVLAKKLPAEFRLAESGMQRKPVWAGLLAFWGTTGLFLIVWLTSASTMPATMAFLMLAAWIGLCLAAAGWLLGWKAGTWKHELALAVGGLGFLILLTPIHEFDVSRIDDPSGMLIVGLLFTAFLAFVGVRAAREQRNALEV